MRMTATRFHMLATSAEEEGKVNGETTEGLQSVFHNVLVIRLGDRYMTVLPR